MKPALTRATLLAAALALVGVACSPEAERTQLPDAGEALASTTTTLAPELPPLDVTGKLLVLGDEYEITIIDPDGHRITLGCGEEDLLALHEYYGMQPDEIAINRVQANRGR